MSYKAFVYGALRKARDDGHIFLDIGTIACNEESAEIRAKTIDANIPSYAKGNPFFKVSKFMVTEVSE